MQVSWIDADKLKALVEQIAPREDRVVVSQTMVEIETEPVAAVSWDPVHDFTQGSPFAEESPVEEQDEKVHSSAVEAPCPQEPCLEEKVEPDFEAEAPAFDEDDAGGHDSHGHVLRNPAAALPLSRIRDKLRAIRLRATEAGILTRPAEVLPKTQEIVEAAGQALNDERDAPVMEDPSSAVSTEPDAGETTARQPAPSFEIRGGSREDRLAAFTGWAGQVLRENGGHVLVMNDEGEVLHGGRAKAGLVLSTMMAWGAAIRAGASAGSSPPPVIRQPLASGHVLTVIPCETSAGMVHAAVAAPEGLSDELAMILRGGLCAAMKC